MEKIDLKDTYWERIRGYPTEFKIDARWILKKESDDKIYGSLRIVSHPDLRPGYLRAYITYVVNKDKRDEFEMLKAIESYQMDVNELEVYSVDEEVKTENDTYEAPLRELEEMFDIKILDKKRNNE